jgi:glycosyltransferase involved in cell wall biosynthesis
MRLTIATSVVHYRHDGLLHAYGPYAREIDLWTEMFSNVTIAAPLRNECPPGDCRPLSGVNISLTALPEVGGPRMRDKAILALSVPSLLWSLMKAMLPADAIHVRCPGNVGLLGTLFAPCFSKYVVAKYANSWADFPGESWTARLQKRILRSRWWRGPVLVYGKWPNQPDNIVPFFTSILSQRQIDQERLLGSRSPRDLRLIYVGRLSASKNVDVTLRALKCLADEQIHFRFAVVGEGAERARLEALCEELELTDNVKFCGGMGFEATIEQIKQSDVLVLASETEGWPKAIAEGMAFGLVCIGSNRGFVPEMLSNKRGITVLPGDVNSLAGALLDIARNPGLYQGMRENAAAWGRQYTLEKFGEAIANLLIARWQLNPQRLRDGVK